MSSAAPTRQALRHLRHLCTAEPFTSTRAPACQPAGPRREASATPAATRTSCLLPSRRSFSTRRGLSQEARSSSAASPSASSTDGLKHTHTHGHAHSHHPNRHHQHDKPEPTTKEDASTTTATPDITNHYTLFPTTLAAGPPPHGPFDIPAAQLKREFLQLQALHHPDKYHHSPAAHRHARAMSSLLNTAYKTLADPLLRARYLLHHSYGVDITAEDNNTHRGLSDQHTLLEVLEAQEAIEEATTQAQIDSLKEENDARIRDTEKLLAEAFEKEDIELAKRECIRLNYWRSLQQGLHDWEPGKEVRLIH
ncbi:hypothetical protein A1O3_00226 [Capronia epimyces CBS 606.96]|uniref:J domain-containing protein n=1 Tax=Capronia epimyces CBS 606.96 TaxID=1182542 RepID=W9YQY4_9EURO|nr:uncharacterized protein A1O3_00226 [Capronia epimyces CBS 606.96]EXJ91676.1 hypothetical protein A1O3_00226 [Capronia epimyces CBS 606.96]